MVLDRRTVVPTVAAAVAVLALTVVAAVAAHIPAPRPAPVVVPTASRAVAGPPGGAMPDPPQPVATWAVLLAVVGLVAVVGPMIYLAVRYGIARRRARRSTVEPEHRIAEAPETTRSAATTAALDEAVDRLDAGGDAREVVIACWVRLEAAADAAGVGRRPAETATDVARRWLAATPGAGSEAVDDLAALFHEARFSTHPVTDAQRARARAALLALIGASV